MHSVAILEAESVMMRLLLLFISSGMFFVCTRCAPAEIVSYVFESKPDGYYFTYTTSDHQQREEFGHFVIADDYKEPILKVDGSYSYVENGTVFRVVYRADENGYKTTTVQQNAIEDDTTTGSPIPDIRDRFESVDINFRISPDVLASLSGGGIG